jgi:DNA polymerase V
MKSDRDQPSNVLPISGSRHQPLRITEFYMPELSDTIALPLFLAPVSAGSPMSAEDYVERKLDISRHLVKNPATTFLVRVTGNSMTGAGIQSGDLLVVDSSIEAEDGKVVIAVVDGELTVKRLRRDGEAISLLPENPDYAPIELAIDASFQIWGVVTSVIHAL